MERIACRECRQCNRKGKPSIARGSAYCDSHYIHRAKTKRGWFSFITDVKNKFMDKRTKYNEDGTIKEFNKKGFRESWFYRD